MTSWEEGGNAAKGSLLRSLLPSGLTLIVGAIGTVFWWLVTQNISHVVALQERTRQDVQELKLDVKAHLEDQERHLGRIERRWIDGQVLPSTTPKSVSELFNVDKGEQ